MGSPQLVRLDRLCVFHLRIPLCQHVLWVLGIGTEWMLLFVQRIKIMGGLKTNQPPIKLQMLYCLRDVSDYYLSATVQSCCLPVVMAGRHFSIFCAISLPLVFMPNASHGLVPS